MTDIAPLIKRSLVDQALDQLRQRITQGKWAIGERLPTEPELSAELGISRNTVREAMRVLAFSGLIEIRQGDGSYLRSMTDPLGVMNAMSHCTLFQAQETRQILEVEAIGLAALRRTPEDLRRLREALDASGEHYQGDLEHYIRCDLVFHKRLVDAGVLSSQDWNDARRLPPAFRQDLKIIHETPDYPRALAMVRGDLDPKVEARLREVLLEAADDPAAREAMNLFFRTTRFLPMDAESKQGLDRLREGATRVREHVE